MRFDKCSLEKDLQIGLFKSTLLNFLPLCLSHTVRRRTVRKSEVREMPSLPRGGGDELVRDEQVSSRRVRRNSVCSLFCLFSWLKNPLLSYLNFMARSSPGTRLLPWHLTPCQHMYPLKPSLTVCVYVCM